MTVFARPGHIALALIAAALLATVSVALIFSGAVSPFSQRTFDADAYGASTFTFEPLAFDDIPGWRSDEQAEALPTFRRSCARFERGDPSAPANPVEALGPDVAVASLSGRIADWLPACAAAAKIEDLPYADESARNHIAREFFEESFVALRIIDRRDPRADGPARGRGPWENRFGRFTGYFEPLYPARRARVGPFTAAVYARPEDLIMVDLGQFREDLAGRRVAGAVKNGRLVPYADHSAINAGALDANARVIAWMKPTDLLFLQIQGSGKLRFADRTEQRIGYDGANGHPYTAIGRVLIEEKAISREDMSMQAIRAWLDRAPPGEAQRVREANASYVFFRELDDLPEPELGPLGAGGVQLTSGRSLDRKSVV